MMARFDEDIPESQISWSEAPIRQWETDDGVGSTVYVRSSGSDASGDGLASGTAYATILRALRDIGEANDTTVTIDVGSGTFVWPLQLAGLHNVTVQGSTPTVDVTYDITTVVTSTDAGGHVLDLTVAGLSADDLRGKIIKFVGDAPDGKYGVIVRNDVSGGGVTRCYVTQDDVSTIRVPVAGTTTIQVLTQGTVCTIAGASDLHGCKGFAVNDIEFQGLTSNRTFGFSGGGGLITMQRCRWTTLIGRVLVTAGAEVLFVACYGAPAGTNGILSVGENSSTTAIGGRATAHLRRGTVWDGVNSATPFISVGQMGALLFNGDVAFRALGANGVLVHGGFVGLFNGNQAHHTLRLDSCLAGFIFNGDMSGNANGAPGGFSQLPDLYGFGPTGSKGVRSIYCITAQRGAYVRLGVNSSCPTGDGATTYETGTTNAVSADGGSSAVAQNAADATIVFNGAVAATGWSSSGIALGANELLVDPAGSGTNVYTTIAAALTAAATGGYMLKLVPATYSEKNLSVPASTTLIGIGGSQRVTVQGDNTASVFSTIGDDCTLRGLTINGGGTSVRCIAAFANANRLELDDILVNNANYAIDVTGTGHKFSRIRYGSTITNNVIAWSSTNARASVHDLRPDNPASLPGCGAVVDAAGAGQVIDIYDSDLAATGTTKDGVSISGSTALVRLHNCELRGTGDGVEIGGASGKVEMRHCHFSGYANDLTASGTETAKSVKLYGTPWSTVSNKAGFATFIDDASLPYTVALSDETTAITTGAGKLTWRAPFACRVDAVLASLTTASSSGAVTVDINDGGTTILSTKLTIDANEKTSTTAATAAVISDSALANDAEVTFDIDGAGTGAAGLKVTMFLTRTG